jgi:16S rRNA (guanine527-N7)-methyltransferase
VKHPDEDRPAIDRVLAWLQAENPLTETQWMQFDRLAHWLAGEATLAGGIGPAESDRIWSRHLADSLAFAAGWAHRPPPPRLLDVGAGVGLPGLPLAILWPESVVTLLDRSVRRIDLARRAVRVLGVDNVEVRTGDVRAEAGLWEGIVVRAVFSPETAARIGRSLTIPTGTVVVGLRGEVNRSEATRILGAYRSARIAEVPATVLDGDVSLLIMESSAD